jgi:hypothetical protein
MKYRFIVVSTVILIVGFGMFGRIKLSTYTNVTADFDFTNEFSVAEIPASFAIQDCKDLKETLPESSIILKVTPVQSPEFFFKGWQQKVRVESIFSGEGLTEGSEIYITFDRWKVHVASKEMDLSFVNYMKNGADYLIFLDRSIGYTKDGTEIFQLPQDHVIAPVFGYATYDNVIYPVTGESTYVPYSAVSENEFFAVDTEGMEAFLELKNYFMQIYK